MNQQMIDPFPSIGSQLPLEWLESFKTLAEPSFRGKQILDWFYKKYKATSEEMTNLPKPLRNKLQGKLITSKVKEKHLAPDETEKILVTFSDQLSVECVLIRHEGRKTGCISTQVGCPVGCVFCASGIGGVKRNLTVSEIVEQVFHLMKLGDGLDNIVVMGMGEPFLNYANLMKALRIINHPQGFGLGARRITVSTSGVISGIQRFKEEPEQFNLAISLHAADDEQRKILVPNLKPVIVEDLLAEGEAFQKQTGRRLTLEYVLLKGINDSLAAAQLLAKKIKGKKFLVNLIPMNPVSELPYETPLHSTIVDFQAILVKAGITTKLRLQKGDPISAACGQLIRNTLVRS